jgi:hypothetical protein
MTKKSVNVNEVHEKYAHVGERMLRKTLGKFGYEITGIMKACDGCMQAKAKAKAVNKLTKTESTCPGKGCSWIHQVRSHHRLAEADTT